MLLRLCSPYTSFLEKNVFDPIEVEKMFSNVDPLTTLILHGMLIHFFRKEYNTFYKNNDKHKAIILKPLTSNSGLRLYDIMNVFYFYCCSHTTGHNLSFDKYQKHAPTTTNRLKLQHAYLIYFNNKTYTVCDECGNKMRDNKVGPYFNSSREEIQNYFDVDKAETMRLLNDTLYALYANEELTPEESEHIPLLMSINPILDRLLNLPVFVDPF